VLEAITKWKKATKPFKLRRPVVVGKRPAGITIPWQVLLGFCALVIWQVLLVFCALVIIVLGIIAWSYPWFRLPVAYIAITILIFLACLSRYHSPQK
jgi:hypothetical protein